MPPISVKERRNRFPTLKKQSSCRVIANHASSEKEEAEDFTHKVVALQAASRVPKTNPKAFKARGTCILKASDFDRCIDAESRQGRNLVRITRVTGKTTLATNPTESDLGRELVRVPRARKIASSSGKRTVTLSHKVTGKSSKFAQGHDS